MTGCDRYEEALSAMLVDDQWLDMRDFAGACGVSAEWVALHVECGVLAVSGEDPAGWAFRGSEIVRVRKLLALERDFGAQPELAALVVDLQAEIASLRARIG